MAFLLAVKSGGAGALFAAVLASAAVVLLDFVANWLLKKLASAARKVGAKLKGLAEKFKNKRKAKKDAKAAKKHHDDHDGPNGKKHKDKDKDDDDHNKSDRERKKKEEKGKKNQEILAKAQRELPSKIRAVLGKGTRGLVLKGRLAIWRAQYRLTSLRIVGSGERTTIVAKVNPEANLLDIFKLHRDELLAYIRKVAEEARKRAKPEAQKALDSHRTETTTSGATVDRYDFRHPVNPTAVAEALSQMPPRRRGTGSNVGMGEGTARVTGGWGGTKSAQIVEEFDGDKLVRGKGRYHQIAESYSGRGADLAHAMEHFLKTGEATGGFSKNQLTSTALLLEGIEPGTRSDAASVHTAMALDLMKKGVPIEDVLGRDQNGGIHPMSPKGAVPEAKKADEYLDPKQERTPGENTPVAAERHMEREIQLVHAWVNTLDLVFDDKASEREKIDEIKRQIRTRILGPE
jgi:hypothetical protein